MDQDEREARIYQMVVRFYELGNNDPILAPVFAKAITNFPDHFKVVADFWSQHLYGTGRYKGHPFPVHMHLDFGPEAFGAWLNCFTQAVNEVLTPMEAQTALGRARHMTESFKVGLFPFTLPDGTPSRMPHKQG